MHYNIKIVRIFCLWFLSLNISCLLQYIQGSAHVRHFEKSKNLVEDDALNIECHATGYPLPRVYWYFEESLLNHSERVRFTTGDTNPVENSTLRVSGMQYEDAGEYTCEAINVVEEMETRANQTITVRVKGKGPETTKPSLSESKVRDQKQPDHHCQGQR